MKKVLIVLLLSLLPTMFTFSQTIYPKLTQDSLIVITPTQLKKTNLIFLEHQKLKLEVEQLENKIGLHEETNSLLQQLLEVKEQQISNLHKINTFNESLLNIKEEELKKCKVQNRLFVIGGCTICASLIFLLIIGK